MLCRDGDRVWWGNIIIFLIESTHTLHKQQSPRDTCRDAAFLHFRNKYKKITKI